LTAQRRRSSSSIAANLAEGCGRNGDAELAHFCSIAMGSASELEYDLPLAKDLRLLAATDHRTLAGQITEVKRMRTGLHPKLTGERQPLTADGLNARRLQDSPSLRRARLKGVPGRWRSARSRPDPGVAR
jgi:four helix bundle protein